MIYKKILVLTLLFFSISSNIKADNEPIDSDSVILKYTGNEIIIESFKQNSELSMRSISATLLSVKDIKQNNVVGIKEISALVPNLFMPDYGSKMTSPAYIRGIGAHRNSPSVGLYVDGVPYFDRSTLDININDIERIEVLRGPQGTIYGRNTMGGIINVFTKSPLKYKETNLNLSAGNYNNYQTGISHYGNFDQKIGYAISGSYMHSGGYFKNVTTDKKADPMDAISTRARISWLIKTRLSVHLIMAYEYSDQDGYPYRVYDKTTNTINDINYNATSFYRRNLSTNGLNIEYVTDNFKLSSQSSFQYYDGKQGLDQDFTPKDLYYVNFYQRQQMYSQEFNIKSLKEDSKYTWQFGAFGFHQNYYQNNTVEYRTKDSLAIQNVHNPTTGFALYHQSTINDVFLPNLSFTFGVRYDWEKTKSSFERNNINNAGKIYQIPEVKGNDSFSQISPKASVKYALSKDKLAYFSVSRGYKTGGFNNTAKLEQDRTFEPEYSWSYELGTKSSFFDNLLHLDFTLFYINWNNQQISQNKSSVDGGGFVLKNAGKSESKGLEFSTLVNASRNLNFRLSYGYTNAKFKDYKDFDYKTNKPIVNDNNYLPMVPKNTLSLGANYTFDINREWLDNIILNGQYIGVGKLYWNDKNELSQPYYGTYNGKVSLIRKQFSVDLWAKNIGQKDYISYYFTTSGVHYVQKGKPFTCGINMNFKF